MPVDKSAPVDLVQCRSCGGAPDLRRSRAGKWYVRCKKCKDTNRTEECVSKLTICRVWNTRNKEAV